MTSAAMTNRPPRAAGRHGAAARASRRARPRSAAFLALLARYAQGRPRERLQARLADRLAAGFAYSICSRIDPGEGTLTLLQQVLGVLCEREFVLALERLRAGVRLVITRVPGRAVAAFGDVMGGLRDVRA